VTESQFSAGYDNGDVDSAPEALRSLFQLSRLLHSAQAGSPRRDENRSDRDNHEPSTDSSDGPKVEAID